MNSQAITCLARRATHLHSSLRRATPRTQCRPFATPTAPRRSPHASRRETKSTPAQISPRAAALVVGAGLLSLAYSFYKSVPTKLDAAALDSGHAYHQETTHDGRDPRFPRFRLSEVRKHGATSPNPWVIHGDKVYDITEWISAHPGGQVILRAAGGSIEPYWNIFTIHKNQYVYDILDQYLIGYVDQADLVDGKPAQEQIEDPFADDPERHTALITRTLKPRNAETPGEALSAQFLTPNDLFYVRNHMWVPKLTEKEADAHILTVELVDGTTKKYTLQDLKAKFPMRKVTAVLQCSGNRRSHMSKESGRKANGLPWEAGAISNASWEGVLLADVLADAGFDPKTVFDGTSETQHVHFGAMEAYAASIPIKKAIDPHGDVLLAYGMNGKPLPRDHGYPLRSVVPGHVAARSVKWLNQITLSEEESTSQWQRRDYKCFGPNQTKVDWDAAPAIQELPVQSAITSVNLGDGWMVSKSSSGTDAPAKQLSLSGYAYSGGGRSIIRVDVSVDDGKSWKQAYLMPDCVSKNGSPSPCYGHGSWSWKRWRFDGSVPLDVFQAPKKNKTNVEDADKDTIHRGETTNKAADEKDQASSGRDGKRCTTIVVKATDDVYNTQPESHAATWNLRGNLATAWHRIQVCTDCSPAVISSTKK